MKQALIIFIFLLISQYKTAQSISSENGVTTYTSINGLKFKTGDTLTIAPLNSYTSIYKGKGLSIKPINTAMESKKCVISKIKNSFNLDQAICIAEKQTYTVYFEVAITLNEILLSNEQQDQIYNFQNQPREKTDDYTGFDFQGITWKSNKKDVLAAYPEAKDLNSIVSIDTNLGTFNTNLIFKFEFDELVLVAYSFKEEHTNDNLFINDYNEIKGLLVEKYGDPDSDQKYWNNDLYKSNYSRHGFAVSLGHLVYETIWNLPDVDIVLKLTGDNYKISHLLGYRRYPALKKSKTKSDILKKI